MADPQETFEATRNQLLQEGYSHTDIEGWVKQQRTTLSAEGYSDDELNAYFGKAAHDPDADLKLIQGLMDEAYMPENASAWETFKHGVENSTVGIMYNKKLPEKQVHPDAPWTSMMSESAGHMVGDLPLMVLGAFGGAVAGGPPGPQTAPAAMAGGFALPAALREHYTQSIERGEIDDFDEFLSRLGGIYTETGKGLITGAATGKAGEMAKAAAPVFKSTAAITAETGTMVTVGAALEGRVPSAAEFRDAAVLIVGFKGVTTAATSTLHMVYAKTGKRPAEVIQDMNSDKSIQQDIIAGQIPEAYKTMIPRVDTRITVDQVKPVPKITQPDPPKAEPVQRSDAENKVLSRLSVGEKDRPRTSLLDEFYKQWVDDIYMLDKRGTKELTEKGQKLPAWEDPYKLARLSRGVGGKINHFLELGTFRFGDYVETGKSFTKVLEPVKNDLDGIRAYMVSKTVVEREARGIATGVDLDAAKAVVAEGSAKYEKVFREIREYEDATLAYLRDSGVLSEEDFLRIRQYQKDHAPLQRVMETEKKKKASGVDSSLEARDPVKKAKGSEKQIIDPLESIMRNTQMYLMMAERNAVGTALVELSKTAIHGETVVKKSKRQIRSVKITEGEIAEHLEKAKIDLGADFNPGDLTVFRAKTARTGENEIVVFEKGKPVIYEVDPEVAAAMKGLDAETTNKLIRAISAPARLLRAGATLTPEFMVKNLVRDTQGAAIYSVGGFRPFIDTMSGLSSLLGKDQAYRDYMKSGGGMASLVSVDRKYLQESMNKILTERPVQNLVKDPLLVLRMFSEASEVATRLGEFKRVTRGDRSKQAIQEGGFSAREVTLDFARMGAAGRALNQISAFSNAKIQGTDRFLRAVKDSPLGTSAKVLSYVAMPSILIHATHYEPDDQGGWKLADWYKDIPEWERDLFYILKMPGEDGPIVRIPKTHELGVIFGTGSERFMDWLVANEPNTIPHVLGLTAKNALPNLLPTAMVPFVEATTNYSTFTGRELVPAAKERLLPAYQYRPNTTELTKEISRMLGDVPLFTESKYISPVAIDSFIYNWTGGLGRYANQTLDFLLRKGGALEDIVKPASRLTELPVVKAFFITQPSMSAQPIADFYERYSSNEKFFNTFQSLLKEGKVDEAMNIMNMRPDAIVRLVHIKGAMDNLNAQIHILEAAPDIPAEEKRQNLDQLIFAITEVARSGVEAMKEVEKNIGKR